MPCLFESERQALRHDDAADAAFTPREARDTMPRVMRVH